MSYKRFKKIILSVVSFSLTKSFLVQGSLGFSYVAYYGDHYGKKGWQVNFQKVWPKEVVCSENVIYLRSRLIKRTFVKWFGDNIVDSSDVGYEANL